MLSHAYFRMTPHTITWAWYPSSLTLKMKRKQFPDSIYSSQCSFLNSTQCPLVMQFKTEQAYYNF